MTIIELNIAGLHVTRSGSDFTREAFKRMWQRKSWRPAHLRPRQAPERSAA